MEANWLDKTVWILFATRTRKRAVVVMAFGCAFIIFPFAYYLYTYGLLPHPVFLAFITPVALALILAGSSRLLYDDRRTLARLLGLVAIVLVAVFWALILTGFIYAH